MKLRVGVFDTVLERRASFQKAVFVIEAAFLSVHLCSLTRALQFLAPECGGNRDLRYLFQDGA